MAMTVGELIERLMDLDPSMEISMAMNREYQEEVEPDFVRVVDYGDGPILMIADHW